MTKSEVRKKFISSIKKLLKDADEARVMGDDIRKSFGECGAFQDKAWEAYYKEESAEFMIYYFLGEEYSFRNNKRDWIKR